MTSSAAVRRSGARTRARDARAPRAVQSDGASSTGHVALVGTGTRTAAFASALEADGFDVQPLADVRAVPNLPARRRYDIVVVDASDGDVAAVVAAARHAAPGATIVVLGGEQSERAVAAIRAGAAGWMASAVGPQGLVRALHAIDAGEVVLPRGAVTALVEELRTSPHLQVRREDGSVAVLSRREADVLAALGEGKSTAEAAAELFIAKATVRSHVSSACAKLGVTDRAAAVGLFTSGRWGQKTSDSRARAASPTS